MNKTINNLIRSLKERRRRNFLIRQNKYCFKLNKREMNICKKMGFSYSDYGMFRYNGEPIDNYIPTLDSYVPRFNNGIFCEISDNKLLFPYILEKYFVVAKNYAVIQKGKIIAIGDSNFDERNYLSFLKKHSLIIKPMDGYDGLSINKLEYNNGNLVLNGEIIDEEYLREFFSKKDGFIIQEALKQDSFFENLYNKSINTIRIVSARTSSELSHEIIIAVQRIGTKESMPADNFSKGGLSSLIDIKTGKLSKATGAKSIIDNKRVFFSNHPDTNSQIEGLVIPKWELIKESIINFTKCFPFFNYIAWDICLNNNGDPMVIETNMKSSLGLFQVHGGLKQSKLNDIIQKLKIK